MKPCIPASELRLKTLELLKHRPVTLTLQKIADDTGLPVTWLLKISTNKTISSTVDRVEHLYVYLNGGKRLGL